MQVMIHLIWIPTLWSLIVTIIRGPGYVPIGNDRQVEAEPFFHGPTNTHSTDTASLMYDLRTRSPPRSRRRPSLTDQDSGLGSEVDLEDGSSKYSKESNRISEDFIDVLPKVPSPAESTDLLGRTAGTESAWTVKSDGRLRYCRKVSYWLSATIELWHMSHLVPVS